MPIAQVAGNALASINFTAGERFLRKSCSTVFVRGRIARATASRVVDALVERLPHTYEPAHISWHEGSRCRGHLVPAGQQLLCLALYGRQRLRRGRAAAARSPLCHTRYARPIAPMPELLCLAWTRKSSTVSGNAPTHGTGTRARDAPRRLRPRAAPYDVVCR